ncbi:isochorismatase family protein [Paenibacillus sp. D2_2]|uniref:isochorismatase family protein n=1 Tax=Paenibacillus sp. D2_2 TaxID=3073092 RepID=UPI0028163A1A|nr:isochorismatase family protein [Paenibacillus sp. D2_2]WMT39519.1 isochorismatase family protein [Paenibacillus sp. D2_2]
MSTLNIDFSKTALVIIDLQKGITKMFGGTQEVVDQAARLVELFRQKDGFIAFVKVAMHDGRDSLKPTTDQPPRAMSSIPADWAELAPEFRVTGQDYIVTKRQWGAFFGTDLDLQLRRRGIDTIVLCGVSTNIGVEGTAREAYQHGYNQIFITDAMAAASEEEHQSSCKYIFPRIGKLRTTEEFVAEVGSGE